MTPQEKDDLLSQIDGQATGRTSPKIGPSDSSDTASELPADFPDSDSDRQNTGERAQVENTTEPEPDDISPDDAVSEDGAGLSYSPPDPARNGGEDTEDDLEP